MNYIQESSGSEETRAVQKGKGPSVEHTTSCAQEDASSALHTHTPPYGPKCTEIWCRVKTPGTHSATGLVTLPANTTVSCTKEQKDTAATELTCLFMESLAS